MNKGEHGVIAHVHRHQTPKISRENFGKAKENGLHTSFNHSQLYWYHREKNMTNLFIIKDHPKAIPARRQPRRPSSAKIVTLRAMRSVTNFVRRCFSYCVNLLTLFDFSLFLERFFRKTYCVQP
jgi:hypothetical protein